MFTILLEIKVKGRPAFYNPAVEECRAYPRTEKGVERAMRKFMTFIESRKDWIIEARVVLYEGRYEYWKTGMEPVMMKDIYKQCLRNE